MKLKSEHLQAEFEEIGAIRIPNFLNQEAIEEIKSLYNELELSNLGGIYTNAKDQEAEYNYKVDQTFKRLFATSIEKHFTNYQIGGGAFLIKGTGKDSHSSLHQDWNVVDETKYKSAAIFCPIQDVDHENGCLAVIKGSHLWFKNIRSYEYPSPFLNFDQVQKGLKFFPAKAGDAVIFRHNVIHGSQPNLTSNNRVAASVSVASKEASYIHYFKNGDSFNVVKAGSDFFNEKVSKLYANASVDFEKLDSIPFNPEKLITFETLFQKYKQVYYPSPIEKIKRLFKSK